jgi:hypothetical protein
MERKPVPLAAWLQTTTLLTSKLREVRVDWFSQCVNCLEEFNKRLFTQNSNLVYTVQRRDLTRGIENIVKAMQLMQVCGTIRSRGYLSAEQIDDFNTLLHAQVCGEDLADCARQCTRLDDEYKRGNQALSFSTEIAKYILNEAVAPLHAACLMIALPMFVSNSRHLVALVFNDKELSEQLLAESKPRLKDSQENQRPSPPRAE